MIREEYLKVTNAFAIRMFNNYWAINGVECSFFQAVEALPVLFIYSYACNKDGI